MNETELARMVVRLLGDSTSYIRMLTESNAATRAVTNQLMVQAATIEGYQRNIMGFASQVKYTLLSALGVVSLFGIGLSALQKSAAAEDLKTSFGIFLKDIEKGEILFRKIQQFAAETPFGTEQLAKVAKLLLQVNAVTADTVIPTLGMLGDVASGNAERMYLLGLAFGQVKTFGRLMGQELMQLRNAGFDPLAEMARTSGKDVTFFTEQMHKGLVTFDMVRQAFVTATSAGGNFFEGTKKGSQTLSGLWSTLKDDVDAAMQVIGDAIVKGFNLKQVIIDLDNFAKDVRKWVVDVAVNGFLFLRDKVVEFVRANMDVIIIAGKVVAALIGIWAALKAGALAIGLVTFMIQALKIDLIVSTAVWLAWGAAVLLVKGVLAATTLFIQTVWVAAMIAGKLAVIAFNVAMTVGEAIYGSVLATLTGVGGFTMPMLTISTLAATAATWLFNAALAVMDALLAPELLIAAAAALGVIAAAALLAAAGVAVIASGFVAAWQAGKTLIAVLMEIGNQAAGPLAQIGPMFAEWGNLISDLTRAIQVDFALAWRLVEAYAMLAVEQVKVLWPPLWEFIQTGFDIIWTEVTRSFKQVFYETLLDIYTTTVKVLKDISIAALLAITNPAAVAAGMLDDQVAKVGDELQAKIAENAGNNWQKQLNDAAEKLRKAWENMDQMGIAGAKDRINKIRDDMELDEWMKEQLKLIDEDEMAKIGKAGQEAANQGLKPIEKAAKHAHQAVQELKGALVNSNEGYQRLLEQRDFLEGRGLGRAAVDPKTGRIQIDMQKSEKILGMIASNTNPKNNPPPLILQAAGI